MRGDPRRVPAVCRADPDDELLPTGADDLRGGVAERLAKPLPLPAHDGEDELHDRRAEVPGQARALSSQALLAPRPIRHAAKSGSELLTLLIAALVASIAVASMSPALTQGVVE